MAASDYAVTANGGDYTVHVVVGIDPDGRMYLLDLWRKQAVVGRMGRGVLLASQGMEAARMGRGAGPDQGRRRAVPRAHATRAPGISSTAETFPTRGDKAVRAQSIRGRMALHGLYVPSERVMGCRACDRSCCHSRPASTTTRWMRLGLIGQLLDTISAGNKPQLAEALKPHNGYRRI